MLFPISLLGIVCLVGANPVLPNAAQINADSPYNLAVDAEFDPITPDQFKCLYKQGYKTVFVQAHDGYYGPRFDNDSIISFKNAAASGVSINMGVTLQMTHTVTGVKQLDDTYYTLQRAGITIKAFVLVVDEFALTNWLGDPFFNQNDRANFINDVKNEAKRLNLSMGILTNKHDWPQIVGPNNVMVGSGTFLWYRSVHSGGLTGETPSNFDDFTTFGAWTKPTLKMFGVEEAVCGVTMLNRDVYQSLPHL